MLGLIFIYFVGKAFYDLAGVHDKPQWKFAILGVGSYYLSLLMTALVLGIVIGIVSPEMLDDGSSDMKFSLMAIPIGILACWLYYRHLKRSWEAKTTARAIDNPMLDADLTNEK